MLALPMRLPRPTNPLLAGRDGRLFLGAQALDALAQGISGVALPWLVLDGGGSAGAAGLVATMALVPYVLFGLVAGVVGDRLARRPLLLGAHATQAVAALAIPLWTLSGHPPLGIVLAAAFVIGSCRVFADAAAFGAVSSIVGREHFTQGQAILSAAWSLGLVIGPAAGGALIALFGAGRALALEALAFALAALLLVCVRDRLAAPQDRPAERPREAIVEGLRVIGREPVIRAFFVMSSAWNIVAVGVLTLMVPLLRQDIGLSASQAGWALASGAAMGVVAAPLVGPLDRRFGGVTIVLWGSAVNGVTALGVGLAWSFWAVLPAIAALYLAEWVTMAAFIGERQRRAPEHLQARVGISGRTINMAAGTVGAALASGATAFAGLREIYVAMALGTLVLAAGAWRPIRRAEQRSRTR
jgi:MFS family permease